MAEILAFYAQYGLWMTVIAVVGIIILGILKYAELFDGLPEDKRHYVYIAISVGFSLIGTVVYLAITGGLTWQTFILTGTSIYALNQAIYNIFKVTPICDLFEKILNFFFVPKNSNSEDKK